MDWPVATTIISATGGIIAIIYKMIGGDENVESIAKQKDGNLDDFKMGVQKDISALQINYTSLEKNLGEFKKDNKEDFRLVTDKIDDLKDILIEHCNHTI